MQGCKAVGCGGGEVQEYGALRLFGCRGAGLQDFEVKGCRGVEGRRGVVGGQRRGGGKDVGS